MNKSGSDGLDQMGVWENFGRGVAGALGIITVGHHIFGAELEKGGDWQGGDKIADGTRRIKGRADKQRVRARENRDH